MKTWDLIYETSYFPVKYYKQFIICIIAFIINDFIIKYLDSFKFGSKWSVLIFIIDIIISLITLGWVLRITHNLIDKETVEYEVNIINNFKEGLKEVLLEGVYLIFACIYILGICIMTKLYYLNELNFIFLNKFIYEILNINSIITIILNPNISGLINIILNNIEKLPLIVLCLMIVILSILTSFELISKIRLKETGSLKKALNTRIILKKIKLMGIKRYSICIFLISVICIITYIVLINFEELEVIGVIISSTVEIYSIFIGLKTFNMLYYDV